jgi:hypothetical protein
MINGGQLGDEPYDLALGTAKRGSAGILPCLSRGLGLYVGQALGIDSLA